MIVWAPWHPRHGYEIPHCFEGPIAFADLDSRLLNTIKELNADAGTNNRNGWRAVKTVLVRAP
ncbi:hypothetical protein [Bradyrhizobium sp. WSM4349]|uniref:hypothetical protein n=1 Tax=Bradyrhizobium sp. WSM4349 TaxID=1040988 RepID=UPI0003634D6E|nr:hypothetical protein [Bradyrhizobium sp. WSM4349]